MNVALSPEVERLVLSWGSQVEVLGPASLRQKLWEEAMAIVNRGAVLPPVMCGSTRVAPTLVL
jgi:predicted DNA-binding transcriptional regulator YafY